MADDVSDALISVLEASGDLPRLKAFVAAKVCSVLNGENSGSKPIKLESPDDVCAGVVIGWLEAKGLKMTASVLKLEANINGKVEELKANETLQQALGLSQNNGPLLNQLIEVPTKLTSGQSQSSPSPGINSSPTGLITGTSPNSTYSLTNHGNINESLGGNASTLTPETVNSTTSSRSQHNNNNINIENKNNSNNSSNVPATNTFTSNTLGTGSSSSQKHPHGSSAFSEIPTVGATNLSLSSGSRNGDNEEEGSGLEILDDIPAQKHQQPSEVLKKISYRTVDMLDGILGSAKDPTTNIDRLFDEANGMESPSSESSVSGPSLDKLVAEGTGSSDSV